MEDQYDEIWESIVNFPNYEVSDQGRILNIRRQALISTPLNRVTGYLQVSLWQNGQAKRTSVHRTVAIAFLGEPFYNADVNHIDGNKINNCIWNLEWLSRGDNHRHAYRTQLRAPVRNNMRPIRCNELNEEFESIVDCANALNVRPSTISNCLSGRSSNWRDFTFDYV